MRPLSRREWRVVLELPVVALSDYLQGVLRSHKLVIQKWVDGAPIECKAPLDDVWKPVCRSSQSFSPIFYYQEVKPK